MVPPLVTASRCAPRPAGEGAGDAGPRRCAGAARRTRRWGSGRRACRAPTRGPSGGARRTARPGAPGPRASSTAQSSRAHMATTCWASTSSGLAGTCSDSIAPARIRSTTTAVCTRSPRNFGKSTPRRHGADLVAGAADPLQAAGHARRGLDLDDEVDRAHVDAELEAARRDDGGQPAGLEVVLDQGPLLLAHRAVVGAGEHGRGAAARRRPGPSPAPAAAAERCGRRHGIRRGRPCSSPSAAATPLLPDLVEPGGQPLGEAAGVGEDERRAVLGDEVDDALLDVRPDRGAPLRAGRRPGRGRR